MLGNAYVGLPCVKLISWLCVVLMVYHMLFLCSFLPMAWPGIKTVLAQGSIVGCAFELFDIN
jgi:hypothetical protein